MKCNLNGLNDNYRRDYRFIQTLDLYILIPNKFEYSKYEGI